MHIFFYPFCFARQPSLTPQTQPRNAHNQPRTAARKALTISPSPIKNMLKNTIFQQALLPGQEKALPLHSQIAGWSSGSSLGS